MSAWIKNGKPGAFNMYHPGPVMLLFILIALQGTLTVQGQSSLPAAGKDWVIVIDAGHGGKDPGALGGNSFEKNITLAIALKTGEYIERNISNAKVFYTRSNDTFVDIWERANIANKKNADLFISIHSNWAKSKAIQGAETFVMGLAKDQQNLEVAMKENEVILLENDHSTKYEGFDPKSPESYVMFTLMQDIYLEQSTQLASKIQDQFRQRISRTDRGVKQAGFVVLYMTTMPSVLVETGFITNPEEEKYLNSKTGQDYLASSIYRACRDYLREVESKSTFMNGQKKEQGANQDQTAPNSLKQADPVENKQSVPADTRKTADKTRNQSAQPIVPSANNDSLIEFRVQIKKSPVRTDTKPENFNGISDITEISTTEGFRYVSGIFPDYPSALRYRKKIESVYPEAFVIAFRGNKILPLQEAIGRTSKK